MRLFVALEVPEGPRREAAERVARIRGRLPPARWVNLEGIHLTLVFLGPTDDALVPGLCAALARAAAAHGPMALRLGDGGTFPPRGSARVAWIGVQAGPELAALHADVTAAAVAAAGIEPETRPYHPHVTAARCPAPWPRAAVETWADALAGPVGEAFAVDRVTLFESRLSPRGARYEVAETFLLAGEAGR